jgi:uncharacterized protein (TIGR02246 family)
MRTSALFILLAIGVATLAAQGPDPSDVLKQRVLAFQSAWNAHDAVAVTALFSADADLIMEDEPLVQGKSAILHWWRDRFAAMAKGTSISLTVRTVRSLTSDVALLNVAAKSSGELPQDRSVGSSEDRGTWIMFRQGGQWFISALRVQQVERARGR